MNTNDKFIKIIIIIMIIIIIIYFLWIYLQNRIINEIENFMKENDIIEGKDITFNTDKKKYLMDVSSRGNLAFGEGYMYGLWTSDDLYILFCKILKNKSYSKYGNGNLLLKKLLRIIVPKQTDSLNMINKHYNLGNDFFASWLDKNMQYSCGYFDDPNINLNEAQINKMDLIARKLKLKKGMTVADIGCGWGGLANYLATKYGVKVVGINLSTEQLKYAEEKYGKNKNVKFILGDFSEILKLNKKFDRVLSIGFYEHVGKDRYNEFYMVMNKCLKEKGLCLLHTIGAPYSEDSTDEWILKYIFTRGKIPNFCDISKNAQANDLIIEDWHNFGLDYTKTLEAWNRKFQKTYNPKTDIIFYRMWTYYLQSCRAVFETQNIYLWQVVFSKKGDKVRYKGVR